jgi:1,2-diacylglycerol 3-beta-galactosyltransferase
MIDQTSRIRRILFLFSDTGGGHRSAAEAIIEALHINYGDQILPEMVDIFKDYAPRPLNYMPDIYPQLVRIPQAWGMSFYLSNGTRRSRLITDGSWPYIRDAIRKLVAQHTTDLIVSVHPLGVTPTLRALGKNHPPFITVVTDLVTTHAFWFHRGTDLCLVPTDAARQRALRCGLLPDQVQVVGLPVANKFTQPHGDKAALREQLGWPANLSIVLLIGGGEGMGPIEKTAQLIANSNLPLGLVIITGRNQKLQKRLETKTWPKPTFIYGFVKQMPDFMGAADILVTKAGPGTISEGLISGLPMILYSRLPGQEDGNVAYVVSEGAGVWAPQPEKIIHALKTWIEHPSRREQAEEACRRIARPQAANQIAKILAKYVGINPQV